MDDKTDYLSAYSTYAPARREFLNKLGCDDSFRDPLSEFAERLVCHCLKGTLAASRVQRDFDMTTPDHRHVQVKVLSNPRGKWRNEHRVEFRGDTVDYAIAFFEDFKFHVVIIFNKDRLTELCDKLKKRHSDKDKLLLLTQVNFKAMMEDPEVFKRECGVQFINK